MSSITFSKINLANLIDHHIALLERFGIKDEAPFSLIFSHSISEKKSITWKFFNAFYAKQTLFLAMKMIMLSCSQELIEMVQQTFYREFKFLDQEPLDNIVTYPEDGTHSHELIKKLRDVIEDNCNLTPELLK